MVCDPWYDGKPVENFNTKAFKKAAEPAGVRRLRWHDLRHTGAFWAVHAAVRASSAVNDPAVRELARRFTADVAALDTEEAAWLEQPRAVSIDASPRPLAEASDQPRSRLQTTATTSISSRAVVRQSY